MINHDCLWLPSADVVYKINYITSYLHGTIIFYFGPEMAQQKGNFLLYD